MQIELENQLREWAGIYNDPAYFEEDPILFPKEMLRKGGSLQDVEIAGLFSAHLAWGRRAMIVRDGYRLLEQMDWRPYDYVMSGDYRDDDSSLHRTIKWSESAAICRRLKALYEAGMESVEELSPQEIRSKIYGQKEDPKAANKKINMFRRWMVRRDGKVDLGLWEHSDPADLIMPLDVHVYTQASALGLCSRKAKDLSTALEITQAFKEIWPEAPLLGDSALFGYGVSRKDA